MAQGRFSLADFAPPEQATPAAAVPGAGRFRAEDFDAANFSTTNAVDGDGNPVVADEGGIVDSLTTFVKRVVPRVNPVALAQDFGKMVIPETAARALGAGDEEASQYGLQNNLQNLLGAHGELFTKAKAAFDKGEYTNAAIKAFFGSIPAVGPDFAQMGENAEKGNWAEALGDAVGLALGGFVAPAVLGKIKPTVGKVLPAAQTAEEAAAVEFGRARGVPIDASTATGNRYVQGVQGMADRSPLGSVVAGRAGTEQAQALRRVAGDLKSDASPVPIDAIGAAERVTEALETKIRKHHTDANVAYDKLREFEQAATPDMVAANGVIRDASGSSAASFNDMQLAVNLKGPKKSLQPIYDTLNQANAVVPFADGTTKASALRTLSRLMNGPDYAPLSIVDDALGDLKALARNGDMPELRTQGQGIAATAVQRLDAQVRARAAQAGPDVLKALEDGRAATRAKFAASDARDIIVKSKSSAEPRAIFNRLTANDDGGLLTLRELQKTAPEELPNVARALLEDILEGPMAEGGFGHSQKALSDWQRVGSASKRLLFHKPGQVQAIDNFFLLAKKIGENPNPSGTALTANSMGQTVLVFTNPAYGVPVVLGSGALSKILHHPKAVQFLTRGVKISVNPSTASRSMAAGQFARAAQEAGVAIPFPKAAEGEPPQQ